MVNFKKYRNFYIIFLSLFLLNSCSWLSKEWEERPKWLMPDTVESKDVNPTASSNTVLVSGFNLSSSQSEVKKKISNGGLKYEKSQNDKKDKLVSFSFGGTLINVPNQFNYSSSNSTVNFFEGSILSTRVIFNAINEENLEVIVNSLYNVLVENYSNPDSENSIYSFQTYKWNNENLEIFLSVDEENKRVLITEINSQLEETRSFKEFKNKYIEQYQTYDEEVKYGKPNR